MSRRHGVGNGAPGVAPGPLRRRTGATGATGPAVQERPLAVKFTRGGSSGGDGYFDARPNTPGWVPLGNPTVDLPFQTIMR